MLSEIARYTFEKYKSVSYRRLYDLLFSRSQGKIKSFSDNFLDLNLDCDFDEKGKVSDIKLIS